MKKVFLILMIFSFLYSNDGKNCNEIYTIYYVPLSVNTYIPINRRDLLHVKPFIMQSYKINKLFNALKSNNSKKIEDNQVFNLRILIKDSCKKEIILTQQKEVVSILNKKLYIINQKLVNDVIDEISKIGKMKLNTSKIIKIIKKGQGLKNLDKDI